MKSEISTSFKAFFEKKIPCTKTKLAEDRTCVVLTKFHDFKNCSFKFNEVSLKFHEVSHFSKFHEVS